MKKRILSIVMITVFGVMGYGQDNPFGGISRAIMGGRTGVSVRSEGANNWDRGTFFSNIIWNNVDKKWESSASSTYRDFGMIRFKNASEIGFYSFNPGVLTEKFSISNSEISQYERMTITNKGNVGIGTVSPVSKLEVLGVITSSHSNGNKLSMITSGDGNSYLNYGGGNANSRIGFQIGGSSKMSILNNGNVGIGTTSPDEKLTVKGKIHAEEVRVDLDVPADYVFEKYYRGVSELKADYSMPTLEEVEAFTKENNHLPNVPSAKTIREEGLHLKEMTNLLLQKVEELTLYTIEQQKQLKSQQVEIESLKIKLSEME